MLSNCPKGMELDCTTWENVTFEKVVSNEIYIKRNNKAPSFDKIVILNQYGCTTNHQDEKCRIFPKGKTTWEGFTPPYQFKDGDILAHGDTIFIYNGLENNLSYGAYVITDCYGVFGINLLSKKYGTRFATEEEKHILFDAIRVNGYKWDNETKTLVKLVKPIFKVWDTIKNIKDKTIHTINYIYHDSYGLCDGHLLYFKEQDQYELVTDKFDITTLVPFESRVLVRNDINQLWIPAFWGYKRDNGYATTFGWSQYCIPYEGNEHLLNTANDCDNFFKVWEES